MKLNAAYWVIAGVLAVTGAVMMGCAFVQRANHPDGKTWTDSFEEFDNIELKAGFCTVHVEPVGEDEECRIDFVNMPKDTEAYVDGDTLVIDDNIEKRNHFRIISFGDFDWQIGELTIYLPEKDYDKIKLSMGVMDSSIIEGISCDTLILETGVGDVDLTDTVILKDFEADFGTGDCTMRDVTVKGKSDIDFGVGTFRADDVQMMQKCDLDMGTGDCDISDSLFGGLELDSGVGDVTLNSTELKGDVNISLGTGDMEFDLIGDPMDFNFRADDGIGDVTIDGEYINTMNNFDAKYEFKVDSGVGDIDISFRK